MTTWPDLKSKHWAEWAQQLITVFSKMAELIGVCVRFNQLQITTSTIITSYWFVILLALRYSHIISFSGAVGKQIQLEKFSGIFEMYHPFSLLLWCLYSLNHCCRHWGQVVWTVVEIYRKTQQTAIWSLTPGGFDALFEAIYCFYSQEEKSQSPDPASFGNARLDLKLCVSINKHYHY